MIITEQLVQEVDGGIRNKALVLWGDEFAPRLTGISAKNLIVLHIQLQIILFQIREQLVRSKNSSNLNELIIVIMSMEEGLLTEDLNG